MNTRIPSQSLAALEHVVHGSLHLTHGSVLRVDDGADLVAYVWEGTVWLTQEGDLADRIVSAGEAFRLDRNGTAVLCALERSTLTLTAPRPSFFASRILHYRAGSSDPRVLYDARGPREGGDARAPRAGRAAAALAWLRHRWVALFAPRSVPTTASL